MNIIIVDALNFLDRFCPSPRRNRNFRDSTTQRLYAECFARTKFFADVARANDITFIFVFDAGTNSDATQHVWVSRRLTEVKSGIRSLPFGSNLVFMTALLKNNLKVLNAHDMDGDDCVAWLARDLNACILSGDRDYLSYGVFELKRLLTDFLIVDKQFKFRERKLQLKMAPRSLPTETISEAKIREYEVYTKTPLEHMAYRQKWRRGCPDAFTKSHKNLHIHARPLRAAVYYVLGVDKVEEILPEYNNARHGAEITNTIVSADPSMCYLLDDAPAAFKWLLAKSGSIHRARPCAMIVAEIYESVHPTNTDHFAVRTYSLYEHLVQEFAEAGSVRLFNPFGGIRCFNHATCKQYYFVSREPVNLCENCYYKA